MPLIDIDGDYVYHDQGIKLIASDKHKIGICLENHMELGLGYSLEKSFSYYLNSVKAEAMKKVDLMTAFMMFPKFFIKEVVEENDKVNIFEEIKQSDTFLNIVRWCDDGFEVLNSKVKNLPLMKAGFFLVMLRSSKNAALNLQKMISLNIH